MKKKILSLLLILAVAAGALMFAVGAEGGHEAHCACLYAVTGAEADKCAAHNDSQAWTALDPAALPTSGYYYLTENLVLSAQWNISGDLHLCTNGYDITRASTAAENLFGLIRVADGKTLTITNCKAVIANGRLDTSNADKTSTLSGAKSSNTCGALIHLNTNSKLNLFGVEIANNTSSSTNTSGWGAGAVLACNTGINMDIAYSAFRNNSATVTGGGALTIRGGTANIRNTVFSGNTAEKHGAAIYMCNAASTVTITDCDFTGNIAKSGEGGAALYLGKGSATLTNVTMTGNENKGLHGSAITQNGGTSLKLNGCTITGNTNHSEDKRAAIVSISDISEFSISGKTVISGNLNNGKESNILLREHNSKQPKITVNALAESSNLSVRTVTDKAAGDFLKAGTGCPVLNGEKAYITYENAQLSSDPNSQSNYVVYYNGTAFSLGGLTDHNHAACACAITGASCDVAATSVAWQKWVSKTALPTVAGYYYLTGDVTLSAQQPISGDVHICTNGYDITRASTAAENLFGLIRVADGKTLTITNCKAVIANGRLDTSNADKTSTLSGAKSSNTCGALIHLNTNSKLNLIGVEIANNTSSSTNTSGWGAGAVLACNTGINMDIAYSAFRNNSATVTGGGALTIRGGTTNIRNTVFSGNTAEKQGAAIYMCNAASTVTITDSDFTGNITKSGEGGAALYLGKGSATLTNVTMTGNENQGLHGSAITQNGGTSLKLNGCTITGNTNAHDDKRAAIVSISDISEFSISGKTVISGNLNKGKESNILLREYNDHQPKITVNALTEDSSLSVRTVTDKAAGDFLKAGTGCPMLNGETVCITYENAQFSSNPNSQSNYIVYYNGTAFSLGGLTDHNHAACACAITGASCDVAATSVAWQRWVSKTALPTVAGYYYLTGDVTLSAQQAISGDVHICTNGYDITRASTAAENLFGLIRVGDNQSLTIMNCKAVVTDGQLDTSNADKTSTLSGAKSSNTCGALIHANKGANVNLYGVEFKNNQTSSDHASWSASALLAVGNNGTKEQNIRIAYSAFNENQAATVGGALTFQGGVVKINNTTFNKNVAANGGAISLVNNDPNVSLTDCVFTDNGVLSDESKTASGGAIYANKGTLTATNVIFTGNRAEAGGAVFVANPTVTISKCTFSENEALNGSALVVSGANATVSDSDIKENLSAQSGAVYIRGGGTATFNNVTISENENTGPNGSALTAESGSTVVINGCRILNNKNTYDSLHAAVVMVDKAQLTVSGETVIDQNLNGGTERNVFLRTVNTAPKMTVGQLSGNASISVATSATETDPNNFLVKGVSGDWSPAWNDRWLSYDNNSMAISYDSQKQFFFKAEGHHDDHCLCAGKDAKCDHTLVTWAPWGKSDSLPTSGNFYLTKDVVLTKSVDINNTTLNLCLNGHNITQTGGAQILNIVGENGVLSISDCSAKTADGVYIAGMLTGGTNGAVLVRNNVLNLYDGIISGNTRTSTGGAVVMLGDGTFNMYDGQISRNESTNSSAGAVSVEKGSVFHLYGGMLSNNKSMQGGAIALNDGTLYMYGGTIRDNTATKHGGGIHLFKSTAEISGGTIFKNTAAGGAGIQVSKDSKLTMTGGKIEGNLTKGNGGGIQLSENSQLQFTDGDICWNEATLGAGVYLHGSQITVSGGRIRNNTTASVNEKNEVVYGSGGGILAVANSAVKMTDGRVQDNVAWHGSGIYVINCQLQVSGGYIQNNGFIKDDKQQTVTICRMGGGIYANGSEVMVSGGEIRGNRSENGGGIYVRQGSSFTMTGGEIANNAATTGNGGGLVVASSSKGVLQDGKIRNNNAKVLGGGVFVDGDKYTSGENKGQMDPDQGSHFVMSGGAVQNNEAEKGGGVLLINYCHMDFTGGTITNNKASNNGGGLFVANFCTMKMTDGTIKGNKAVSGAGLIAYKAKADIYGGTITENAAQENGGGIFSQTESAITLHGGTVSKNTAKSMGGGLFANVKSSLGIYGGKVTENTAEKGGGALIIDKSELTVKGGTVEKNTATNNGGGLFVANDSQMTMSGGTVKQNKAISGAGLAAYKAKATLTGGVIEENESTQHAAGFLIQRDSVITMKDVTIRKNTAEQNAGAIHISGFATLGMENTIIEENAAGMSGGGVFASGDQTLVTMKETVVRNNTAGMSGGGLSAMSYAKILMESGKINGNQAAESGGGVYIRKGYLEILSGEVFQNTAGTTGGGLSVEGIDIPMKQDILITTADVKVYENTAQKGGGIYLASGQGRLNGTLVENNDATLGGGFYAGSMARSFLENLTVQGNAATSDGGGLYFQRGTKSYLTGCQIINNQSDGEGGGIWLNDDFQADSCRVTGNKAKGAGGIYIAPASYDGESYVSSIIKLGGEMYVTENQGSCSGIYIGEGTYINLLPKGLTEGTKIDVTLHSGVLTRTVIGAYDYEGGDLHYVITAGDRSITDPEPVPQKNAPKDVTDIVWIVIAAVAAVLAAAGIILVLLKKKKAQK